MRAEIKCSNNIWIELINATIYERLTWKTVSLVCIKIMPINSIVCVVNWWGKQMSCFTNISAATCHLKSVSHEINACFDELFTCFFSPLSKYHFCLPGASIDFSWWPHKSVQKKFNFQNDSLIMIEYDKKNKNMELF